MAVSLCQARYIRRILAETLVHDGANNGVPKTEVRASRVADHLLPHPGIPGELSGRRGNFGSQNKFSNVWELVRFRSRTSTTAHLLLRLAYDICPQYPQGAWCWQIGHWTQWIQIYSHMKYRPGSDFKLMRALPSMANIATISLLAPGQIYRR